MSNLKIGSKTNVTFAADYSIARLFCRNLDTYCERISLADEGIHNQAIEEEFTLDVPVAYLVFGTITGQCIFATLDSSVAVGWYSGLACILVLPSGV